MNLKIHQRFFQLKSTTKIERYVGFQYATEERKLVLIAHIIAACKGHEDKTCLAKLIFIERQEVILVNSWVFALC